MNDSQDPNQLLAQVSLANQQAFKTLYKITSAKLFAVALRITKQEKLSEEILQDSFMKIWQSAKQFDPEKAQAITWMGTIVRNKSIDALRKGKKYSDNTLLDDNQSMPHDDVETPEQLVLRHSELGAVKLCLGELNEQQREAILLAYLDGYTHQQIADLRTVPVGSVKTWIYRGINQLKICLQRGSKA